MSSFFNFLSRAFTSFNPPVALSTGGKRVRFGILSTAEIAVQALILAARSHPEVEVYAVGGRSQEKTEAFAKKHGIQNLHFGENGYQSLVEDPNVDAVYIPLPNGLHYEWTMKALAAGKHVLVEKPIASTPDEALKMHLYAEEKGLVLLEGMHIRFHPALNRVKEVLESGELGALKNISTTMFLPKGVAHGYGDEAFEFGRGSIADIGCYCIDTIRFLTSSSPLSVSTASATPYSPTLAQLDRSAIGTLAFPNDVTASFDVNLSTPLKWGFIPKFDFSVTAECENGSVKLSEYMMPQVFHSITVAKRGGKRRVEKAYRFPSNSGEREAPVKGEEWWSTFRHQLEAFVDRVNERPTRIWYEKEDSVAEVEWIQKVYEKSGLARRPASSYYLRTHGEYLK